MTAFSDTFRAEFSRRFRQKLGLVSDHTDGHPELIEALNDKDNLVRVAANDALIAITGEDMNFSAQLSRNERTRKQREWRTWFKANESTLRAKLKQPKK